MVPQPLRDNLPRPRRWLIALAVIVVVAAFAGYSYAETYRIEVKEYTYTSPQVPSAFDGARIVLLTDIHRAFFFSQERVGKVVDQVNALAPDLVLLGGDYVYGSKTYEASVFAELGRLDAPLGTFAVLGNHDYEQGEGFNDPGPALKAMAAAKVTPLDNDAVWFERAGQRIRVGGVSDLRRGYPDADPTVEGTKPDDLVLLVSHQPDFAEVLAPGSVDLVLSGHTHGGQLTFFGLWAPFTASQYGQKYRTGMVANEDLTVIISNGIGTILPPLRFFARPQIVVVTLEKSP